MEIPIEEQVLQECKNEIIRLRKENQILNAQMYVVETFRMALSANQVYQGSPMSVDVCFYIDKAIETAKNPKTETAE